MTNTNKIPQNQKLQLILSLYIDTYHNHHNKEEFTESTPLIPEPNDIVIAYLPTKQITTLALIKDKFQDDIYELIKMSEFYELGNDNDTIIDLSNIGLNKYIIENWNTFYLSRQYIIAVISDITKHNTQSITQYNPIISRTFHQLEAELLRDYKLIPLYEE